VPDIKNKPEFVEVRKNEIGGDSVLRSDEKKFPRGLRGGADAYACRGKGGP